MTITKEYLVNTTMMKAKFAGVCVSCGEEAKKGSNILFNKVEKTLLCDNCRVQGSAMKREFGMSAAEVSKIF
jgi:hypothetical protein